MADTLRYISFVILINLLLLAGCIREKTDDTRVAQAAISDAMREMIDESQHLAAANVADVEAKVRLDLQHRRQVFNLLARGEIENPIDLFNAALIVETADPASCRDCYLLAHSLALRAVELGYAPARSRAATYLDRYLVQANLPQKFGTQQFTDSLGVVSLFPVDSLTTDSVRALWDILPLDSLQAAVLRLNVQFEKRD